MIVPLTTCEQWLDRFRNLPELQISRKPVLVVAPHPDDETLGAGALIATLRSLGVPVSVVAATDGENAYDTPPEERARLASIREAEQRYALEALGVDPACIHRLRLPDSGLAGCVEQLTERLLALTGSGTHLIAPWIGDFHPDHVACAQAAQAVVEETGCELTSYFFWTWHRGTPDLLDSLHPRRFVPEKCALDAKAAALRCHVSQLHHNGPEEAILPERLLGPASWPCEIFLPAEADLLQPDTTSAGFFDAKYRAAADPWNFATDTYEQRRYRIVMQALGDRRFASAFEPGCSVGVLTEMLAGIADGVLACDFSSTAAEKAQQRCAGLPNVTVRCAALTGDEPLGSFDLVVLSEIGYYFSRDKLETLLHRMADGLQPGATVLACHWLGSSPDHILSGDAVHNLLAAEPLLQHVHGERHAEQDTQRPGGFRLDLWRRQ